MVRTQRGERCGKFSPTPSRDDDLEHLIRAPLMVPLDERTGERGGGRERELCKMHPHVRTHACIAFTYVRLVTLVTHNIGMDNLRLAFVGWRASV